MDVNQWGPWIVIVCGAGWLFWPTVFCIETIRINRRMGAGFRGRTLEFRSLWALLARVIHAATPARSASEDGTTRCLAGASGHLLRGTKTDPAVTSLAALAG